MLGISTTNLRVNGFRGKGLSTEAQAWRTNIIANGGTIPDATLLIFDNYFFKPAKANGNILSELDRLNIYCGLVGYEIAARTNVIKSAHYVTPVSSPTFDNNGYKSSGTSYLDLNYNPFSQGVKLTQNSASFGYVVLNPTYTSQKRALGNTVAAITCRLDMQRDGSGNNAFINSPTAITDTNKPTGIVHASAIRTGAVTAKLITNGTETASASVSAAPPDNDAYELILNNNGTPATPADIVSHLASFHGSGSLDYTSLRTILNNLFTALGV